MTSTIDILKNIMDGKSIDPATVKLGGPDAPYRKEQEARQQALALEAKEQLATTMKQGVWVIEFTKVDGTPATMECTLDPDILAQAGELHETTSTRESNPTVLRVYAVDRQGWRSFKVLNLTKIYRQPEVL